jgi:magnesium-transporting ATPase (P-type)
MVISEGDRVAADATLMTAHELMLDESLLTGESVAVLEMIIDPACSMVFEAEEADVMSRPPRDPKSPLLLPKRIAGHSYKE